MEAYTKFSSIYDEFMSEVPYEKWASQVIDILKKHNINEGIIADLGCGTGEFTKILSQAGYDMIGIDNSYDMLEVATYKKGDSSILYLNQDMREFELYGTCAAITSICDSMNYILEYEDLVRVLKLVNNYLDPGGVFIFDCNSIYKYENILGENTIAETKDIGSFIWENYYDTDERINEYSLIFYIRDDMDKDIYRKFEELHIQRAYSIEEIKSAAKDAGLIWGDVLDADTYSDISDTTERYLITLYENGKVK